MSMISIALILASYLLGSISCAIIACRILAVSNPRYGGSGNPGTSNVLRLYGWRAALPTLGGDVLKGSLSVLLAAWLARRGVVPHLLPLFCAAATVLGHIYPAYSGLRHGGKGVATLFGTLCALHWMLGLLFMGGWLALAGLSRYVSVASLGAAACVSIAAPLVLRETAAAFIYGGLFLLLLWRHRDNLKRLKQGTENRFSLKPIGF